jgi:5-methylthioadenosine/S-adenosylhomocysteine deaminase
MVLLLDGAGSAGELSVAIDGARIAAVGSLSDLRARFPGAERIDCSHRVLMPGLINAHLHPEMHVVKGIVEQLGLHAWARDGRFNRALALLGTEEYRWVQRAGIRAAFADALLTGTTRVATYAVTIGGDVVAEEELSRLRLPGHVAIRDVEFRPATGPDGSVRVPAFALDPPRMYRLHAEEALSDAELRGAAAAHERGERLIMHAAETPHRIRLAETRFGASTIRLLDRYGLLSARMLLSHAIHVDAEERALIAERGAVVISSPAAELKLSDGIAPIQHYIDDGVTVALGTDSAICNNSGDMLLECRMLGLTQKLAEGAHAMPAERIVQCATRDGARALGEHEQRGAIAAGLAADLVLVDVRNTRMQPLVHGGGFSNVATNLVYSATGQDVTDVMIAGQWVVRDRTLLTADHDAIVADLARAAREIHSRLAQGK